MGVLTRAVRSKSFNVGSGFTSLLDTTTGNLSGTGARINRDKANRYSAYFSARKIIAEDVAKLPLHVYRDLPPGDARLPEFPRERGGRMMATDSPWYDLLHRSPAPRFTSYRWRELMQAHIIDAGNCYAVKNRDGTGQVRELQPLMADRVTPWVDDNGDRMWMYDHSRVGTIPLQLDDVFHVPGLGYDGIVGYSLLTVMRDAIALGLGHESFGTSFYRNGIRPSIVATHPGTLGDTARERLQNALDDRHAGTGKSFRALLLEEGVSVTTLNLSAKDAQFIEGRDFQVEELARFTRISPHKLMSRKAGAMSYASVEEYNLDHARDTLQPWLERWEQDYNLQLLPRDMYAKHSLNALLRGNTAARTAYYREMAGIKALVPNEVREFEELDPVPWGWDPILTPNNSTQDTTADQTATAAELVGKGFDPEATFAAFGVQPIPFRPPESKATEVHFHAGDVAAPTVTVQPAEVTVHPAITVPVTVKAEMPTQPAPVVHVAAPEVKVDVSPTPVTVTAPDVTVNVPETTYTHILSTPAVSASVKRDRSGNVASIEAENV